MNSIIQRLVSTEIGKESILSGQFELTAHCNLNCKMCYIHESTEAGIKPLKPASFWIDIAQQAVDAGMLVLSLSGGETLLYPELDVLMDALSQMGVLISFNTNGTLIDEKRVEWFLQYCPNKINISLYGASDSAYEQLCGIKNGFSRVSRAIDLLMNAGLNVYLNGVITPYNNQELPAMHQFAAQRGLILYLTSYAFPLRSAPGMHLRDEYRLTPEQAAQDYLNNEILTQGREQALLRGASSLQVIDFRKNGLLRDTCHICKGGHGNFQISYDGILHPCAPFSGVSVSLASQSLTEGLKELNEQMEMISFPEKCSICVRKNICPMCKAAVYLETGNHTEAPEYLCRYSQALEQILRKECANVPNSISYRGDLDHHHCSE